MNELIKILNKVKTGIDYLSEKRLVSDGLLDSLDVMTIVTELCDEFDVDILPTDIVPENFESAEAMWRLVERLQED
ncbi:MAG: acyl carrier protein [Coprococcus sp.]